MRFFPLWASTCLYDVNSKANREVQMKDRLVRAHVLSTLTCMALSVGLWMAPAQALAVDSFTALTGAEKNAKPPKPKKSKAPKVKGDKGSAESKSERDKRLLRECRGRPNAGACEGYAS
jgi:hypothetical protein